MANSYASLIEFLAKFIGKLTVYKNFFIISNIDNLSISIVVIYLNLSLTNILDYFNKSTKLYINIAVRVESAPPEIGIKKPEALETKI